MKLFKRIYHYLIVPERLFVCYLSVLMLPNIVLCFTEDMSLLASLSNLLVPASAYTWLFTIKRRPGMMLWVLFPIVFLAAFQLVLLYLFGNAIISVDMFLNVATTNASEANELLDNIYPVVSFVFFIYLPALAMGIHSMIRRDLLAKPFVKRARRYAFAGIAAGAVITGICEITDEDYGIHLDIFPINVCNNMFLSMERSADTEHYKETSQDFKYSARATHDSDDKEIYVMVIGETGRACSWGLYGYERNTTPKLSERSGLTVFSDVLTQSNTTHKSVPMLMSLADAENYDRIYSEKGIMTAFREAGFYTAFFSNQRYSHSFIDIFGYEADTTLFLKEGSMMHENISDMKLTESLEEFLAKGHRKAFVVLHTYGSHFNYSERYAEKDAVFKPDKAKKATIKYKDILINAYDNTIVQTDRFLDGIIEILNRQDATCALLYTSDHGEDIFDDDRERFLHSSPTPTYYQMHVPFITWTSPEYSAKYPDIVRNMKGNKDKPAASNASAIHTIMQIAGIQSPYREDSLSVASDRYNVSARHFISDHNTPEDYDNIGLDDEDFEQFRKHRIKVEM